MKVKDNQSFLDLAIQYNGTAIAAFELAFINNRSLTDDLYTSEILSDLDKDYGFSNVANYFANGGYIPATAVTDTYMESISDLGIGDMIIEQSFIIR